MKDIPDNAKFQLLHQHYKDTFQIIKETTKERSTLIRLIFIILIISVLYTFWPSGFASTVSQVLTKKVGIELNLTSSIGNIVGSIIWLVLLVIIVRYTQVVIYIKRQYEYINRVEAEIHEHYESDSTAFTREGKFEARKNQKISKLTRLSYTVLFPTTLGIIILSIIAKQWLSFIQTLLHQTKPDLATKVMANLPPFLLILLNTILALYAIKFIHLYVKFMKKNRTKDE